MHTAKPGSESLRYTTKSLQRVVGSERFAAPLLMIYAVEHRFGVQALAKVVRGPIMATTAPKGSPPLGLALGAPGLTPSAPSREMGYSAMCARVCGSPAVFCSVTGHVRGIRSPQQLTVKVVSRFKKAFLHLRKPNKSEVGTFVSRLTISPTNN